MNAAFSHKLAFCWFDRFLSDAYSSIPNYECLTKGSINLMDKVISMVTAKIPARIDKLEQERPLDAWMDYQCYWVEGLKTQICNFQGFIKHPEDIPLDYSVDAEQKQQFVNVQMLNVHDGGMVFGACSPVPIGVKINIRVSINGEELSLCGVVTHCIQLDDDHCDIGVQFKQDNEHYAMRMIEQACHIEHYRKAWSAHGRKLTEDEAAKEWIARFAPSFPR